MDFSYRQIGLTDMTRSIYMIRCPASGDRLAKKTGVGADLPDSCAILRAVRPCFNQRHRGDIRCVS